MNWMPREVLPTPVGPERIVTVPRLSPPLQLPVQLWNAEWHIHLIKLDTMVTGFQSRETAHAAGPEADAVLARSKFGTLELCDLNRAAVVIVIHIDNTISEKVQFFTVFACCRY